VEGLRSMSIRMLQRSEFRLYAKSFRLVVSDLYVVQGLRQCPGNNQGEAIEPRRMLC
jgi:hypothetical protein